MRTTAGRWLIEHDPQATRRCYAGLAVGSGCTCDWCRNFDAAAGKIFPADFMPLLEQLGIDPLKPAEVCHYCREDSGLHLMGG